MPSLVRVIWHISNSERNNNSTRFVITVGSRRLVIALHFVSSIFLTSAHCFTDEFKLHFIWSIDCVQFLSVRSPVLLLFWNDILNNRETQNSHFLFHFTFKLKMSRWILWVNKKALNSSWGPINGHCLHSMCSRESGESTNNRPDGHYVSLRLTKL